MDTSLPSHVILNLFPEEMTRLDLEREGDFFLALPDSWRHEDRTPVDVLQTIDNLLEILALTNATTIGEALGVLRRMQMQTTRTVN